MRDIPELITEDKYRVIAYLSATNYETLCAYAAFKNGDAEYIITALIELKLASDPKFVQWRQKHSRSFLPPDNRPVQRSASAAGSPSRPQLLPAPATGRRTGNGRASASEETTS